MIDVGSAFTSFAVIAGVLLPLILGGLYLKFGRGLAMRLMSLMIVAAVITATGFLYAGLEGGGLAVQATVAAVLAPVVLTLFFMVYRDVVTQLDGLSVKLLASTAQIAAGAQEAAAAASEQAATVAQVSATVQELSETSKAAALSAQNVERDGETAMMRGKDGVEAVRQARQVLDLIGQVQEIVGAVSSLADQSNYLAVNAGIEAAKAGEHGRGFAVVAAEVRSLAEQSKRATQRIQNALAGAEQGRQALDVTRDVVERLAVVLEENSDRARHISAVTTQQEAGVTQISDAMASMLSASQSVATMASQFEEAVASLDALAKETRAYVTGRKE